MGKRLGQGSTTRRATEFGDGNWNTWEMVKNRKTINCIDCHKPFPRGVMMFRPKSYKPKSSRQRLCIGCTKGIRNAGS